MSRHIKSNGAAVNRREFLASAVAPSLPGLTSRPGPSWPEASPSAPRGFGISSLIGRRSCGVAGRLVCAAIDLRRNTGPFETGGLGSGRNDHPVRERALGWAAS